MTTGITGQSQSYGHIVIGFCGATPQGDNGQCRITIKQEANAQEQHTNHHLGLKVLLALIVIGLISYTFAAISAGFHLAINTIVLVVGIGLAIYVYIKVKEAEKRHRHQRAAPVSDDGYDS